MESDRKRRITGGNTVYNSLLVLAYLRKSKILILIKAFIPSILFIMLGIYILKITDSIIGTIIGISNIAFFGILIILAIFKICKDSYSITE